MGGGGGGYTGHKGPVVEVVVVEDRVGESTFIKATTLADHCAYHSPLLPYIPQQAANLPPRPLGPN